MKSIKDLREQFDLVTEKEEKEDRKLSALVRAGLYDAKKLPALKKALEKSADKMTAQEKRMLLNLLDSLISQVTSDEQIYRKVKQNVHSLNEAKEDYLSKFDPRFKAGYPSDKDIPTVLILKRKAIRVYPDNQKVALYYSQALDKYVTIPFSDIQTGINEAKEDEKKKKRRSSGFNATEYFKKRNEKTREKASDALNLIKGKGEYSSATKRFAAVRSRVGTTGGAIGVMINDKFRKAAIKRAVEKKKASIKPTASETSTPKTEAKPTAQPKATAPVSAKPKTSPAVSPPKQRSAKEVKKIMAARPDVNYSKAAIKKSLQAEQVNEGALSALDTAADIMVPYYGAGKKALKGDWKGAATDAAIDTALIGAGALTGGAGYVAGKAAKAGIKLGTKAATKKTASGLGKKALNSYKSARRAAGRGARRLGRGAARLGRLAAAAGAGAGATPATDQKQTTNQPKNYEFGLKPKTGSSWQDRADPQAAQKMRDQRLARQSQTAMLKESSVLTAIRDLADNKITEHTVKFDGQEININNTVAKKIMLVYESVNSANKKKMEKMLDESATSFNKVLTFALRQ